MKEPKHADQMTNFFCFENEHNLFEIRTQKGYPLWDIIRFQVWKGIFFDNSFSPIKTGSNKRILKFLKFIVIFFKHLYRKVDVIYFGLSREKSSNDLNYDPYYDSIKLLLPKKHLFYDSYLNGDKYKEVKQVFDVLPYYLKFIKLFCVYNPTQVEDETYDKMVSLINTTFKKTIFTKENIVDLVRDFCISVKFYTWFLNSCKPKKLFFIHNGSKSLLYSALKLNIKTYEFQHGAIDNSIILYSYNNINNFENGNIIFPDYLLTFSNVWVEKILLPSKCIEVGNDFRFNILPKKLIKNQDPKSVVFLSTIEHHLYLKDLAIEFALTNSSYKIYYKLHPQQYQDYNYYKDVFKLYNNIHVLGFEFNMSDALVLYDNFIAIYSTALFEILQSQKRCIIYKRGNYFFFENFFEFDNVSLIDNSRELTMFFEKVKGNPPLKTNNHVFFKPFNSQQFSELLSS